MHLKVKIQQLLKIFDEERQAEEMRQKKQKSSQASGFRGSKITNEDDNFDDYDNLVSKLLTLLHFELLY